MFTYLKKKIFNSAAINRMFFKYSLKDAYFNAPKMLTGGVGQTGNIIKELINANNLLLDTYLRKVFFPNPDIPTIENSRLVHVSSYNVVCGIADYCKNLKEGMDSALSLQSNDVLPIDLEVVYNASEKEIMNYFSELALKCAAYDTVVIQHEYSFFGSSVHGLDFANKLFENFVRKLSEKQNIKNICIVFHSDILYSQIFIRFCSNIAIINKVKSFFLNIDLAGKYMKCGLIPHQLFIPIDNSTKQYSKIKKDVQDKVKQQLLLKDCDVILGMVGFVMKYKRHREIIKLLTELPENYKFLIVGGQHPKDTKNKSLREIVKLIEENSLQTRVYMTGCYEEENLKSYVDLIDIMVAPYDNSFTGGSASIQSMIGAGKPVVAYATNVFVNLNASAGFKPLELVEYDNLEAFKNKIVELGADKKAQEYLVSQINRYAKERSKEKLAQMFAEQFEK